MNNKVEKKINLKEAKKYLSNKEYDQYIHILHKSNTDDLERDELLLLANFIMKIEQEKTIKTFRFLKWFGISIFSFFILTIAFLILGIWFDIFMVLATILQVVANFSVTIIMLKFRFTKGIWLKILWFSAFILNMYFFVNGLLDLLNIDISFKE